MISNTNFGTLTQTSRVPQVRKQSQRAVGGFSKAPKNDGTVPNNLFKLFKYFPSGSRIHMNEKGFSDHHPAGSGCSKVRGKV